MDFNKIMRNKEFPIPFQQKETMDKAAQRITEVVDVSTQTVFTTNVRAFQCQVPETYSTPGSIFDVTKVHNYAKKSIMSTPLKLKSSKLSVRDPDFSPIIDTSGISTTTTNKDDSKVVDYDPSFEELGESETWFGQEDFVPNASFMSHMKMRKFIVFESMLDILFREIKCKRCGLQFEEMEKAVLGTSIHIVAACENGHHIIERKAQPVFGRRPAFNLLVPAVTFCSGK